MTPEIRLALWAAALILTGSALITYAITAGHEHKEEDR